MNILNFQPPAPEEVTHGAQRRNEILFVVLPSVLFGLPLVILNAGVLASVSTSTGLVDLLLVLVMMMEMGDGCDDRSLSLPLTLCV